MKWGCSDSHDYSLSQSLCVVRVPWDSHWLGFTHADLVLVQCAHDVFETVGLFVLMQLWRVFREIDNEARSFKCMCIGPPKIIPGNQSITWHLNIWLKYVLIWLRAQVSHSCHMNMIEQRNQDLKIHLSTLSFIIIYYI